MKRMWEVMLLHPQYNRTHVVGVVAESHDEAGDLVLDWLDGVFSKQEEDHRLTITRPGWHNINRVEKQGLVAPWRKVGVA